MKTLTIKGDYQASNATITGINREIRNFLISEASEKRRASRKRMGKQFDNVLRLTKNKHQSELVNMHSFDIQKQSNEKLIELLNNHGVLKYSIN